MENMDIKEVTQFISTVLGSQLDGKSNTKDNTILLADTAEYGNTVDLDITKMKLGDMVSHHRYKIYIEKIA